jgi:hypothetical protein
MRIEEADLNTLKTAQRRGRVRSPETQELVEAIDSLVPGAAMSVVIEAGETPQKIRARVMYAGKAEKRRPGRPRKNPA